MTMPNLRPVVADGRVWLQSDTGQYDVIALDAYRQPYIPFHLTTVEFFRLAHARLTDNGVLVINVGHSATDFRLLNALAATLHTLFSSVYVISPDVTYNSLLVATRRPSTLADYTANAAQVDNPLLRQVIDTVGGHVTAWQGDGLILTDDLAPVEQITDQIIINYVLRGN
jgi:spermidine synthase